MLTFMFVLTFMFSIFTATFNCVLFVLYTGLLLFYWIVLDVLAACVAAEKVAEEFELPQLTKLQTNIPKVEDIQWCGFLEQYDEQYDRITSRTEKRLQVCSVVV